MSKYLDKLFDRWLVWVGLALGGAALWYFLAGLFGDAYATAIGPDQLAKIPMIFVKLGAVIVAHRLVIARRYTTVYKYTKTSGGQSQYMKAWEAASKNGIVDDQVREANLVHVGVFIGLCLLFGLS